MKKSDLISGKHIVENRNGTRYLFLNEALIGYMTFSDYKLIDDNLLDMVYRQLDIVKVYEIQNYDSAFYYLLKENDIESLKLIWERKPELSEVERVILENVDKKYKYIARDSSRKIYLYKEKPVRSHGVWLSGLDQSVGMHQFGNLFKMIDSESWNPTLIADLLGVDEPFHWPE